MNESKEITYNYWRFFRKLKQTFPSIEEAARYALEGESEGELSSASFVDQDGVVLWDSGGGWENGIFPFCREVLGEDEE